MQIALQRISTRAGECIIPVANANANDSHLDLSIHYEMVISDVLQRECGIERFKRNRKGYNFGKLTGAVND